MPLAVLIQAGERLPEHEPMQCALAAAQAYSNFPDTHVHARLKSSSLMAPVWPTAAEGQALQNDICRS